MQHVIKTAVRDVLSELGIDEVDFTVEHPAELSHGDYACNVAMVAAKVVGKDPRELAEVIAGKLNDQIEYGESIEVAGPGFINFHLARDFFTEEVARSTTQGSKWGHNDDWHGKLVLVEYTDPNPFKEFHIGHLFTNAVGESISRLFAASGADVKRCNYQGDAGLHVAHAIYGMQQLNITPGSQFTATDLGRAYAYGATAYKENESAQQEIRAINKKVYERSDSEINALYDGGRRISLEYFETIYEMVGTQFDEYFFESEAGPVGREIVHKNPEVFVESDGARVFKGEEYGLHTRVFINREGLPTYEAKELALAKMKEERLGVYDYSVISTANEVNEYFKVLLKALELIYPGLAVKTEHLGHGMVRLASGKMSSRTGDVIPAVDFIEEIQAAVTAKMAETGSETDDGVAQQVAIGAIKYATLQSNRLQNSVFDKEKALSFEGDSGPYLQYTHARINSVLEKAVAAGIEPNLEVRPPNAYEIERILYRFPEIVREATKERAPHHVVGYLTELAGAFNTFYANEKIADPDDEYAPYKAVIAKAVGQTLKNGLDILGIKAPQKM